MSTKKKCLSKIANIKYQINEIKNTFDSFLQKVK